MSRRIAVISALAVVAAGLVTLGLSEPAAAAVTTTNITMPVDGAHYSITELAPATLVTVRGTSDGTTGDFVQIRCYYNAYSWDVVVAGLAVEADGQFLTSMSTSKPYGTCVLKAVPSSLASGADTSAYTGPRVTSEQDVPKRITSGPNTGKIVDFYVIYQGSQAMNDYGTAAGGGIDDTRVQYSTGYSSSELWNGNGALAGPDPSEGRASLQIDGHNAYLPNTARLLFAGAQDYPTLPVVTYSVARDSASLTIHEADQLVRCTTDTFPATSTSCTEFVATGVRLERTTLTDDGGRQTHVSDVWRSTDGHAHTISAHYSQSVLDSDPVTGSQTPVGLKLPWLSSSYQTYTSPVLLSGPARAPDTVYARGDNNAPDGDTLLPRGAITFDTAPGFVNRTSNRGFRLREDDIVVPAGGHALVRHDYVIGTTEAEVAAKAAISRAQLNPWRPDALVKKSGATYVGNNVYNATATGQTVTASKKRTRKATFFLQVQNDGTQPDSYRLHGTGARKGFTTTYFTGKQDITTEVRNGTYTLKNLVPGQSNVVRLVIKVKATAKRSILRSWLATATSTHDSRRTDTVEARVKVKR